ncbi:MAG: TetR/AcrR family transcriptional regulator [Pseudomonadota bacterium]
MTETHQKTLNRAPSEKPAATAVKRGYHHGNLREALLVAAEELIAEVGPAGFTLADACRRAGVSTAAPYRHFEDRNALLAAVCMRGFEALARTTGEAKASLPPGTIESILAGSRGYLTFALENPERFKLMFGRQPDITSKPQVEQTGRDCFGNLLDAVSAFLEREGRGGEDPMPLALRIWALVHGVASLVLEGPLEVIAPGNDPGSIIDQAGRAILEGERHRAVGD